MVESSRANATPLYVGAARFTVRGQVRLGRYPSGEIIIEVLDDDDQPQTIATVAVVAAGGPPPGEYHVWLSSSAECRGLPDALVDAGIVTLTGRTLTFGLVQALHAELTPLARSAMHQTIQAEVQLVLEKLHKEVDELVAVGRLLGERGKQIKIGLTQALVEEYVRGGMRAREIIARAIAP
jgi:hypothetical protein